MAEEITAEYPVDALTEAPPLRACVHVTYGAKTDLGRVRENNEDKFEVHQPEDPRLLALRGHVYIVCDGMGGHNAGQIASELACKTFLDVYYNHPAADAQVAARAAVEAANRFVRQVGLAIPSRRGMGTTLTALILLQDQALWVQVGDSRGYVLREGTIRQVTPEHTWIDQAIRSGMLTPEEAATHPYQHVITRAIGTEDAVEADLVLEPVHEGDLFLLCSDGLTNHVSDEALRQAMGEFGPSEACWRLVGSALADGGSDNCTVVIVRVNRIDRQED